MILEFGHFLSSVDAVGEVVPEDFNGHEKYESEEDMYAHYRQYYGDKVDPDTPVKIIRFELK